MNIETTLTIAVEEVRQQAQRLMLNPETNDSGKVLDVLLDAYIGRAVDEKLWEEKKNELECERDEAQDKAADLSDELMTLTRQCIRLVKLWQESRPVRGAAYDFLALDRPAQASELGDSFSDIAAVVSEIEALVQG